MAGHDGKQVEAIGKAFVLGLRRILGDKLYGAAIYGAAAFPDDLPTGDLDFHVILADELSDRERLELEGLHEEIGKAFPPLGGQMDGYYILLADARLAEPPRSQMWNRAVDGSWALHREHILDGRSISLFGPDPSEYLAPPDWTELEEALYDELGYVSDHLDDHPDYCILNLCRLVYSFETGEVVVSKSQASKWAIEVMPSWKDLISLARRSYSGSITEEERRVMAAGSFDFFDHCCGRIEFTGEVADD